MEENSVPELLLKQKAEILQELAAGPLASSLATLSATSRAIPSDKDFHYFYNFDEFKVPVKEIAKKSELILKDIGSSKSLWAEQLIFPTDFEDAYEWLVNINDEVFERFDVSMDEFQRSRKKEEGKNGRGIGSVDSDGFQMIYGKKKKGILRKLEDIEVRDSSSLTSVKMASRDDKTTAARSHVPFHIPSIPRPQDEYNILVDNSNKSFKHVLLQKTEDGSRFMHPLEKFSELDFVDRNIGEVESVKPLPIESTPFTLVERIEDLKELAAKLRAVNEFAVDLEHNQYRSFQGLTCLMQISTRMEDFVVDTLKLRAHIGPHLREAFKDPSKKKVMHGADRDIIWLQRDFSIYVCNLFDTGQASRVLQLERNSLEYLLLHFCGVTANKEYQNADWRLRPLPDEMLKYAREDTHYLLYIYDLMRGRLLSASTDSENGNDLLLEVYKRSYDICMQLYEKELLTDASYLHIYGLNGANFNSQQLAIVAGLCKWRDAVARAEDESTGYILPNKALLEIARQMPVASGKLRWLVKSKYPYVERKLGSVISIIRSSIENADAFESAAEHLNEGQEETASLQEAMDDGSEPILVPEDPTSLETASTQAEIGDPINGQRGKNVSASVSVKVECLEQASTVHGRCSQEDRQPSMSSSEMLSREDEKVKTRQDCCPPEVPKGNVFFSGQMSNVGTETSHSAKAAPAASVQVLKKPSRAFGALLGNSTSKRKLNRDPKGCSLEQDKFGMKVEQIKSSVMLPFHSFDGTSVRSTEPVKFFEFSHPEIKPKLIDDDTISLCKLEDIISLENDSDNPESSEIPEPENGSKHRKWYPQLPEMDTQEEPGSLSDLSSNFQKCFESINEMRNTKQTERRSQESNSYFQLKPFDYAGARKQMRFEEKEGQAPFKKDGQDKTKTPPDAKETRTSSVSVRVSKEEGKKVFLQGRRRQAFPSSGNRSSTFR